MGGLSSRGCLFLFVESGSAVFVLGQGFRARLGPGYVAVEKGQQIQFTEYLLCRLQKPETWAKQGEAGVVDSALKALRERGSRMLAVSLGVQSLEPSSAQPSRLNLLMGCPQYCSLSAA